jgi:probable rRNA maturation factor
LHREFLRQDRPTDVLSFLLDETLTRLDGEVIASADTAAKAARRYGGTADDELLLYVIHGTLHLFGYDDQTAKDQQRMRARETRFMREFGLTPRYSPAGAASAKTARASRRSPTQRS